MQIILSALLSVSFGMYVKVENRAYSHPIYVESDDILEEALQQNLRAYGVYDVDVDEVYNFQQPDQRGMYSVEIESSANSEDEVKDSLIRGLKAIGFSDAIVKPNARKRFQRGYFGINEYNFLLHLNERSMERTLSSLAPNFMFSREEFDNSNESFY